MIKRYLAKAVIFLSLFAVSLISANSQVISSAGCVPVYGGGVSCPRPGDVLLDKKVRNPSTGIYVDNLLPADPTRYRPGSIVYFQILVQNAGDETLSSVSITDTIPAYIDYSSITGSAENVSYDQSLRKLTFNVTNLAGGSKRYYTLNARVVHQSALQDNKSVCPVNVVEAVSSNQATDRDTSQFCIEKVFEVPVVPKAGPQDWLLVFSGLPAALYLGNKLRKFPSRNLKLEI